MSFGVSRKVTVPSCLVGVAFLDSKATEPFLLSRKCCCDRARWWIFDRSALPAKSHHYPIACHGIKFRGSDRTQKDGPRCNPVQSSNGRVCNQISHIANILQQIQNFAVRNLLERLLSREMIALERYGIAVFDSNLDPSVAISLRETAFSNSCISLCG